MLFNCDDRNKAYWAFLKILLITLVFGCVTDKKISRDIKNTQADVQKDEAFGKNNDTSRMVVVPISDSTETKNYSKGIQMLMDALNNYSRVSPHSQKTEEIMLLKGQTFYNLGIYEKAREIYGKVINDFPNSTFKPEAIRMIGQTYYEEKKFEEAEVWYMKLRNVGSTEKTKGEAEIRLAESIYQMAEGFRKSKKHKEAIQYFERIAAEYPKSPLAPLALYNAGLIKEEGKELQEAILTFTMLRKKFPDSDLNERTLFKIAKCYEILGDYAKASKAYLELAETYKTGEMAQNALLNAGICYEKVNKPTLAAHIYEKYSNFFMNAPDAPDVLFKAGEIFGKLEDWKNVERVNKVFGEKYGKDKERVIQAMCMAGVASFMQKKYTEALDQFEKVKTVIKQISEPTKIQRYYAAKSEFTMAQIYYEYAMQIKLIMPEAVYQKRLKEKNDFMQKCIEYFSNVVNYGFLEWSTQALYWVGQSFERFGLDIHEREIPPNLSVEKIIALKMGIAEAVEEYLINKAVKYYEKNILLGIQYKVEDEWVRYSKEKLTKLPTIAGINYMNLTQYLEVPESENMNATQKLRFKLKTLQDVAPFQDRAIALYLKTLEIGSKYQLSDKFTKLAADQITKTSFMVGKTYYEIVDIARSADIPASYSAYEKFLYKVQLIQEHLGLYEEKALASFVKNIKIKEAYGIDDEWIKKSREKIAQIFFERGYCYELLSNLSLNNPPIPPDIATEEEKQEIIAQMEELGLKLEDEAKKMYKDVIEKVKGGLTDGVYVRLAYVRYYKLAPSEVGVKFGHDTLFSIEGGPRWYYTAIEEPRWQEPGFDISSWKVVRKGVIGDSVNILGFENKLPSPMWGGKELEKKSFSVGGQKINYTPYQEIYFRCGFRSAEEPFSAELQWASTGQAEIYVNGLRYIGDSIQYEHPWYLAKKSDISNFIKKGDNVLAFKVLHTHQNAYGLFVQFTYKTKIWEYLPQLPGEDQPLNREAFTHRQFEFPILKNFEEEAAFAGIRGEKR